MANAVKVTLAPKGRNVLIDKSFGAPLVTKDGVTAGERKNWKTSWEHGHRCKVASKTSWRRGLRQRSKYSQLWWKVIAIQLEQPMDLKRGIDKAVVAATGELHRFPKCCRIQGNCTVGTISANSDSTIGDIISEAMEKAGKDGVITVTKARIPAWTSWKVCSLTVDTVLISSPIRMARRPT